MIRLKKVEERGVEGGKEREREREKECSLHKSWNWGEEKNHSSDAQSNQLFCFILFVQWDNVIPTGWEELQECTGGLCRPPGDHLWDSPWFCSISTKPSLLLSMHTILSQNPSTVLAINSRQIKVVGDPISSLIPHI